VEREEWTVGERAYVPRITLDESVELKILKFVGDEDEDDPIVDLLFRERDSKGLIIRECFRSAHLSELEDPPRRATKGGVIARVRRNLIPIECGCGCGQQTSGTEFRQGHDAKRKSFLVRVATGKIDGDVEAAVEELERRRWNK
jgi:hypothetical protein